MSLRILVVDDHDVVRQGVRLILRRHRDWSICGEAEDGEEALQKMKELKPDLVILDITMPGKDGLEFLADFQTGNFLSKVLVLTMHDSRELATALKAAGARGYVIKAHAARDLPLAIQTIINGGDFFSNTTQSPERASAEHSTTKNPLLRLSQIPAIA